MSLGPDDCCIFLYACLNFSYGLLKTLQTNYLSSASSWVSNIQLWNKWTILYCCEYTLKTNSEIYLLFMCIRNKKVLSTYSKAVYIGNIYRHFQHLRLRFTLNYVIIGKIPQKQFRHFPSSLFRQMLRKINWLQPMVIYFVFYPIPY